MLIRTYIVGKVTHKIFPQKFEFYDFRKNFWCKISHYRLVAYLRKFNLQVRTYTHVRMYIRAWPMLVQETATKGHFISTTVSRWLGLQLLTLFLSLRTAASDPVALWTADSMNSMSTVSSALVRVTTLVFSVACNRFVMADQSLMAWVACHKLSTKNTPCSWICGIQNSEQG